MKNNTNRTIQKMLTAEEERDLFIEWKKTHSPKIMERIVKAYEPIVKKCAKKLSGYNVDKQDLLSVGTLALIETIDRFDLNMGFRFATFCYSWVSGLMLAYIAKNYFSVNLASSQDMKKIFFNLRRLINKHMKENDGIEITPEFFSFVAKELEVEEHDVEVMYNMLHKPQESLSDPLSSGGEDEDYTRQDTIASPEIGPDVILVEKKMNTFHRKLINEAMERVLTPREQRIFVAQMLAEDGEITALQDLANDLRLSKERVRQIRDVAYNKVRVAILLKLSPGERVNIFREPTHPSY